MLDSNSKSCWSILTVSVLPFSKIGEGALFSLKKEVNDEATGHSQLTMQVVEHVRALISSGEVHPGDRLPPERELARKLKISRSSLRAGIGFLSAMGVLKSRHGAGTFVSSGPPALDSSSLTVLGALHGFLPWQMFEARIVIEANVASLAAERATDEHIAELAEEVAEMYAALDDPQEYLIHDVRFHRTIARASGNPILGALMETITANLYDNRRLTAGHSQSLKQSAEMHREIFRAIRSRNPIQARRTMEQHLNEARMAEDREQEAADHPLATERAAKEAAKKNATNPAT
jgi:GntR family transcriptional regulator, transcriptional repressor for pyruvate dehydrogenase complex